MNFGEALEALKRGLRAARPSWSGMGVYLLMVTPAELAEPALCVAPYTGRPIRWRPSDEDLLAEDWGTSIPRSLVVDLPTMRTSHVMAIGAARLMGSPIPDDHAVGVELLERAKRLGVAADTLRAVRCEGPGL